MNNRILVIGIALLAAGSLHGRIKYNWSYAELVEKSDLVVIATPVSVEDTNEKTVFPLISRPGDDGESHPVPAVKMKVDFEVLAILKGDEELGDFVFNYLRQDPVPRISVNGPLVPYFRVDEKRRYLMFLLEDLNGGYRSTTGFVDSLDGIKDLGLDP